MRPLVMHRGFMNYENGPRDQQMAPLEFAHELNENILTSLGLSCW